MFHALSNRSRAAAGDASGAGAADRRLLYAAAFLRAMAIGMVGILLGVYLARLHVSASQAGIVVGSGLAGGACAALLATLIGDRWGRRRFLMGLTFVAAAGGAMVAVVSAPAFMSLAAFLGMINGMGRDRGASLVIEQAMLPATTAPACRTRAFAWYNVFQDAGLALGGLAAALPAVLHHRGNIAAGESYRIGLGVYSLLILLTALLYSRLSPGIEPSSPRATARVSPESRRVLRKISALFALDSLGGGFLTPALLSYYFFARFGVDERGIGLLFLGARVANVLSHLGAAWLAARIGLVRTMVFTHIPSSVLLVTVAFAPSFPVAAVLFLFREGLVEMDVPTRQSYVMAVVGPEERTSASGITHLVRLGGWAVAPSFAGLFMQRVSLATPLLVGAGLKILYDVLLYAVFRKRKPPEESLDARPVRSGVSRKG